MIFIPPFPSKTVINGQSKDLLDSTGSEGQGIDGNSLHLIMGFDMCLTNEKNWFNEIEFLFEWDLSSGNQTWQVKSPKNYRSISH